ncbi:hypothetical protein CVT25_014841 [Psilocybe cyanescens]|uniref:UBC core domain-containing protein n=1 Tax=Psilocybe cyanescens TaxID=93625 RepID=A0A409WET2_PSICY|nr:hypothetical protein CVT25_014841 [Psilocybe cyanescens]
MPRSSKRPVSPVQVVKGSSKRRRAAPLPDPKDVIIVGSDAEESEDEELKAILAQIEAQERHIKKPAKKRGEPIASGSKSTPIDLEDDAAMARILAQQWASEDNNGGASSDVEILDGPSISHVNERRPSSPKTRELSISSRFKSRSPHLNNSGIYQSSSIKPDEALEPFKDLFTKTRQCSKCKKSVNSPRGYVVLTESLMPPSMTYLLHASCSSCRTNYCRGCFASVQCPVTCKGPAKNAKCPIMRCCAEGRAIAIFEILGGFDHHYITERAASELRASVIAKSQSKRAEKSVGPGGTGYGYGGETGVGYGGSGDRYAGRRSTNDSDSASGTKHQKDLAQHWDNIVVRALNTLTELLPAPYANDPQVYDILPHVSIGHLINLSQIPTLLATLLRNDSVADWISRKEIYNAMLSLLRRMGDCELTILCLIGQHWDVASTCGLENWMWGDGEITWNDSTTLPLYTFFRKLTKQSEAFMAGAMQMVGGGDADTEVDEMMIQGTSLCGDIIAARDDLERAIAVLGRPDLQERENRGEGEEGRVSGTLQANTEKSRGKGKGRDVSLDFDRVYAEACERLSFKHVSLAEDNVNGDELNYTGYYYAAQLNQTQNSTRVPKYRLHLLKELAVMATSLPPGVWACVDEVRNDAMYVHLECWPDGTPYAGGLFEFDCFIPIQYPENPPLMQLKTTGGGSVRFNPNLYNDGKVCLSLLGTWPGRPEEQWSPKSTLLQVLVSIQSMILIDGPYYNEPGHGQANLKATDVIASHFIIRKEKIRQQIVEWSKTDPSIRAYQASHNYYGGKTWRHESTGSTTTPKVDLLAKFDEGINMIESWKNKENGE